MILVLSTRLTARKTASMQDRRKKAAAIKSKLLSAFICADFLYVDFTDQFEFFLAAEGVFCDVENVSSAVKFFLSLIICNGHTLVVREARCPISLLKVVVIRVSTTLRASVIIGCSSGRDD